MVKTRFAPSPTGYLHIGGARTCLFSWLYARKNKGKFVLRIEDTDTQRSKKEYLDEILQSLSWLGIDWDEVFYQSERFDLYREYADKLIAQGKAYKKEGAVFFKYDFRQIILNDLIRGEIQFNELPKEEEVIIKSDGTPTYNFSCVIDDALMGISHVIRGEDHIPNTPKQILMYEALGFELPSFAHVSLILAEEGGRMSKRFGATSVREYKEMGYLSEAVVNYLLLLSWSPGENQEIISLKEAKEKFDLSSVNKTAAAFSLDKFTWVNSHYIKSTPTKFLYEPAVEVLRKAGINLDAFTKEYILSVIEIFKERLPTLSDLLTRADFCFKDDYLCVPEAKCVLERDLSNQMQQLIEALSNLKNFDKDTIEQEFRAVCTKAGLKAKDLVHPVRVALTGKKVGPGLFETMQVLGKEKVLERLKKLL